MRSEKMSRRGAVIGRIRGMEDREARRSRNRKRMACAIGSACALVGYCDSRSAFATQMSFSAGNTIWLTPANWTPTGPPTSTDDALIGSGTLPITLTSSDQTIQFLTFTDVTDRSLGNSTTSATNSTLTLVGNGGGNPLISMTTATPATNFIIRGPNQANISGAGTFGLIIGASGDFNVASANGGLIISANISETTAGTSINKTGSGYLLLTGSNNYTGGTTVAAGTLEGDTNGLQGNISDSSAVVFDQTVIGTYAGSITGGGTLRKYGAGVLTMSQNNSYTGGLTLNGGGLVLSGTNTPNAVAVSLGNLTLDHTGTSASRLPTSGSEVPLTLGNGTVTVNSNASGASSEAFSNVTLNAGGSTLVVTAGNSTNTSLSLTGTVTRNPGATLNVNLTNVATGVASLSAPNISNDANGLIVGGWATVNGTDWATQSSGIKALTSYTTENNPANFGSTGATANVTNSAAYSGTSPTATIATLRFNAAAASNIAVGASQTLSLSSGGILNTAAVGANLSTISGSTGTITASNGSLVVQQFNPSAGLTISAIVGDSGATSVGLIKAGPGLLTLGNANNFYTGGTTINGGTLSISTDSKLGGTNGGIVLGGGVLASTGTSVTLSPTRAITIAGDGGIDVTSSARTVLYAGAITGSGNFTKWGAGTLTFSSATALSGFNGDLIVNAGTLNFTGGSLPNAYPTEFDPASVTMNGGEIAVRTSSIASSSNRGLTLGASGGTFEIVGTTVQASWAGQISGSGDLIKTGSGSLVLSGVNTYTGRTVISFTGTTAGTLSFNTDAALGAVPASPRSDAIILDGGFLFAANNLTVNANRGITLETIAGGNGNGSLATAATMTVAGTITDLGLNRRLNKGNTGTVILTGTGNTWGLTTVSNGTLALGVVGALPTAPIRLGFNDTNTCAIDLAPSTASTGFDLTTTGITVDGTANGGATLTQTGLDKQFITNSGTDLKTLTINNTASDTFPGIIKGNLNLTKNNNFELILNGKNAYVGSSNVRGGTLTLSNNGTNNAWVPVLTSGVGAPVLTGTGGADIQAGRVNFTYSGGATSPAAQVLADLISSFNAGFATSTNRIRSTTATAFKGLGWKDAGGAVTVADAYYGDANLDGTVTSDDFANLAANFGKTGLGVSDSPWVSGDFNYDGIVNALDFNALATNYGKSVVAALSPSQPVEDAPLASLAASTLVPEPGSLSLLALGAAGLASRRRRSAGK